MDNILFDDQKTRIVLLSRSFGKAGREMKELRVRLSIDGACFFHLSQDEVPLKYGLSPAEADEFCEAWIDHREKQKAGDQAAQDRLKAMIDEAYKIAAWHPAIQIEMHRGYYQPGQAAWQVSVPEIAWGHLGPVGSAKELLNLVKGARDAYQNHLKLMAEAEATA